jgi:hypothetical protein
MLLGLKEILFLNFLNFLGIFLKIRILEVEIGKNGPGILGVNTIDFTLLMLVGIFTLHMLLDLHIAFILLSILSIFLDICTFY